MLMKSIHIIAVAMMVMLSCIVFPPWDVSAGEKAINGDEVIIQPFWMNAESATSFLSFTGKTANCGASVVGMTGTTKISATITLEQKVNGSYSAVKTWTDSVSGSTLNFSNTYSVTSGYTYRLSVSATVTRNGVPESVSASMEKSL